MPDGWLQLIRGPRPQSVKWPTKGSAPPKATARSRRGSQDGRPQLSGQRGPPPEEVVSNAPARVAKLEAAMAVLGESDPTYPALLEALKKVKSQTQVRPVDERIASTRTFLERAPMRIGSCREEVARAQEVLTQAQAKLQSEEQALVEGEARLAALTAESVAPREDVPPTVPANFAHELAELRACVQELRRENTDLRSELQRTERSGGERDPKQAKSLSISSPDLVPLNRSGADHPGFPVGQNQPILNGADASVRMETMIDNADSILRSNRFNPLSG